ncbi:hypothetical protein KXW11_000905, partial [Aspergillus fumigatus]
MLFSNRYTVTYTPVTDNVHPLPDALHVKVKNTSAIALRAAYLHGPYTLYASCYPSTFDPHGHSQDEEIEGIPQFEPYLKAGGSWKAMIPIPKCLRQIPETSASPASIQKVTWVIEIISQVIFSTTAIVNYELLIGRDEESVELPYSGGLSVGRLHLAAHLQDHVNPTTKGRQVVATKGVFSKSVCLRIDDTTSLWNTPPFPSEHDSLDHTGSPSDIPPTERESMERAERPDTTRQNCARRKKVHLVVLTHGLHSNLGADMLYLKESIDAATKKTQSGASCKLRQHLAPQAPKGVSSLDRSIRDNDSVDQDDIDDEQVIVRGFAGNAVRTERGIQYLGKRLAKYVLFMTYPDQPYRPLKQSRTKTFTESLGAWKTAKESVINDPSGSRTRADEAEDEHRYYQITSISFIGHSLGGLVQTYAIAYIQKHSPEFFNLIRPVNFIALATPFLGLSNENPMPKTIFHDRIYYPEDIPPPLSAKRKTSPLSSFESKVSDGPRDSGCDESRSTNDGNSIAGGLKVEEKIARAYHRGMSWRKVLVRLEPDAHNNIIVRRMFTNAYGWPVVKHLVDSHFRQDSLDE